jgi:hypothetical protein
MVRQRQAHLGIQAQDIGQIGRDNKDRPQAGFKGVLKKAAQIRALEQLGRSSQCHRGECARLPGAQPL